VTSSVLIRLHVAVLLSANLTACGGPRIPESPPTEPSATSARQVEAPVVVMTSALPASSSLAKAEPTACPSDMLLIDGDYCTELEVNCLEKFYAPQNHLWVCKRVAEPTRCTGPTRKVRYCIDRYEFPNREGQRPMIMQNFYQAEVHCANRGKRVCTESEWTKACEGPENKPFPYGYVRDPSICNGDKPYGFPDKTKVLERDEGELERLWQGKLSGSQPGCKSDYGVFDMAGNADELAASESEFPGKPKSNFDNVTTGGPWYYGVRNMCRPKIYSHDESFAYYYLSWRCCAEADGKPTDPRAPKQIKRGMTFEKVKNIADNSWKLPFNPLVPGDEGYAPSGRSRQQPTQGMMPHQ
jgi:formylglycine-generating enzyme